MAPAERKTPFEEINFVEVVFNIPELSKLGEEPLPAILYTPSHPFTVKVLPVVKVPAEAKLIV
jgi:hypothetical protein